MFPNFSDYIELSKEHLSTVKAACLAVYHDFAFYFRFYICAGPPHWPFVMFPDLKTVLANDIQICRYAKDAALAWFCATSAVLKEKLSNSQNATTASENALQAVITCQELPQWFVKHELDRCAIWLLRGASVQSGEAGKSTTARCSC